MSTFRVPPGDPAGVRNVVSGLSRLSERVGDTRAARLRSAAGAAEGALPTSRVAAFAGGRQDATKATGAVGLALVTVGGALGEYATALEAAQDAVRSAGDDYESAEVLWRRARSMGEESIAEDQREAMTRHRTAAERAQGDLAEARRAVLQVMRTERDLWVPDDSSLTPVRAWEQAATSMTPAGVSLDRQALRDAFENVDPEVALAATGLSKLVKGGLKGFQGWQVLQYLRAPTLAGRAEQKFLEARQLYQTLKGSSPDLSNPRAYKEYLKAERAMLKAYVKPQTADLARAQQQFKLFRGVQGDAAALRNLARRYPNLSPSQIRGMPGRFDRVLGPVRAVGPAVARVMGPLSIGLGAYDLYTAFTDKTLDRDDAVARGVGGAATIVGGVATTAIILGATAPLLPAIVAVAGVVAVGAWVYENREAIAETAKKVGSAIADGAEKVGGALKDGATKVWKGLFG